MIVFAINAFFFIRRNFTRLFAMLFETDWASSFILTNVDYVIVSLTIEALLDSTIIDKKLACHMCVLVQ
jgi:hypothetical protein